MECSANALNLSWTKHNCHNLRQCATSPKWKQIWMWDTNNSRHQLTVLWCVQFICFTKWYKITWTCVSHQLRNEAADFIVAAALECYCSEPYANPCWSSRLLKTRRHKIFIKYCNACVAHRTFCVSFIVCFFVYSNFFKMWIDIVIIFSF